MVRIFYEKYLPVIFWPIFLGLLTWGTYQVIVEPEVLPPGPETVVVGPAHETLKPRIFESSEDGEVRWELWSESMDGVIGQGSRLTELKVFFTLPDGSQLTVKADQGLYDENEKHLEVTGKVVGEYEEGQISFTCDCVDYFHLEERLAMSGNVNLKSEREGINLICTNVDALLSDNLTSIDFTGGVDIDLYKLK